MTHTSTQQPNALRLTDKYEIEGFSQDHHFAQEQWCWQAVVELRRQHARIEELEDVADMAIKRIAELEAQLSAIGAGGVEPLRKQAAVPQGWKLVPVEPTEKMIIEGGCAQTLKDGHRYIGECTAKTAWSFMLAAAPTPPEAFETEGGLVCENSTSKQGAQASVSNMTSAAPVQMPEPFTTLVRKKSWPTNCYEASPLYNHRDYGRLWANERVNVYTEQQVRALLAEASALAAQAKQGGV